MLDIYCAPELVEEISLYIVKPQRCQRAYRIFVSAAMTTTSVAQDLQDQSRTILAHLLLTR